MSKYPKPIGENYLILPEKEEKQNTGGVYMPDEMKDKPKIGKILAVGSGGQAPETGVVIQMEAKVGDRVLFSRFGGAGINIEGEQHLILRQSELLLIL